MSSTRHTSFHYNVLSSRKSSETKKKNTIISVIIIRGRWRGKDFSWSWLVWLYQIIPITFDLPILKWLNLMLTRSLNSALATSVMIVRMPRVLDGMQFASSSQKNRNFLYSYVVEGDKYGISPSATFVV